MAEFGKPTKKGIPFKATLPVISEEGPLKQLVDMAWQSVKAKLVRGVSIGFRALKYDIMSEGGLNFKETEIYELSLVTIPANASATIQTIKSMDTVGRKSGGGVPLMQKEPEKANRPADGSVILKTF